MVLGRKEMGVSMSEFEIVYDYCGEYDEDYNIRETFYGSWFELQDYLKRMKENGCYNIDVAEIPRD